MKRIAILILIVSVVQVHAQVCEINTNSVIFNGNSTQVSTTSGNGLSFTTDVTVEAWIKATLWKANNYEGSIVCKHGWSTGEAGFVLRAGNNGQLNFNIAWRDTNGVAQSWRNVSSASGAMLTNTWYHVAGTYDGTQIRIYINGNFIDSLVIYGTIVASPNYNVKIGGLSDIQALNRYWAGYIDEVRIWDHALTQAEIQSRMDHHINPATQIGLAAYWRFNDGIASLVTDLTGNYNGTLNGGSWNTDVPFNNPLPVATITPPGPVSVCDSAQITLTATNGTGYTYIWNTGDTTQAIDVDNAGIYSVIITDQSGCSDTANATVTFNTSPIVSLSLNPDTVCLNTPSYTLTGGVPVGGTYTGPGINLNTFNPSVAGPGTHPIIYLYTDTNGCSNTSSAQIFVDACTGLNTAPEASNITLTPNPFDTYLRVTTIANAESEILIYDISSRKLLHQQFTNSASLNTEQLAKGIYLYEVRNKNGPDSYRVIKKGKVVKD